MKKAFPIGTEVKIVDCFFYNWIGLKAKITKVITQKPLTYKLDMGGHFLHDSLEKV